MKKVLHVITGLNDGGAEGVLARLCVNDHDLQHVVVSLMDGGKYKDLLELKGIRCLSLNMSRGTFSIRAFINLVKIIKREKPYIVQTWMYHADLYGGLAAKIAGCKNIYWGVRHSNLSAEVNSKKTLLVIKICSYLSRVVPQKVIYCAEKAKEVHEDFGYVKSSAVVRNGYDVKRFKLADDKLNTYFDIDKKTPLIGFVARWDPQKDHVNLLKATQIVRNVVPNVKCILVGSNCDSNNQELVNLIEKLGLDNSIILLGPQDNIPRVMNSLDLHVLSSCGEAFPNVVAEAMACGTPCVVTDVGDAKSIVGNTGWVVPVRDSKALANSILMAIKEKENNAISWQSRRLNCRSRIVEEFSLPIMISAFHEVWL
ncbi:glycosyltransferase [Vibrio sp. 431]|uniref:glycosyltransferase family 4 protein n=1 Tax=Vibrio TaxID=662 RepID=UPI0029642E9D|nr:MULTISPECIES: glycosyltransferase [unclassified Vibrio]MDW1964773.1 glycosyltransferase [Vibrio sp. Vb0587]MDW2006636.1 glycosyltransferase [Vibrio sp. 431]